jgi:hypothetical protein
MELVDQNILADPITSGGLLLLYRARKQGNCLADCSRQGSRMPGT